MKKQRFGNAQPSGTKRPHIKEPMGSPIAKAAALKYDGANTPKLVAKGEGAIAKEIVAIAQDNEVHIHYDPLLLEVLSKLEMGDEIPETLYLGVAKIIAFAYYLQGKHPDRKTDKSNQSDLTLSSDDKQNQELHTKDN